MNIEGPDVNVHPIYMLIFIGFFILLL